MFSPFFPLVEAKSEGDLQFFAVNDGDILAKVGILLWLQSPDSLFCEAEVFFACYDDVVHDFDVEDLSALDQFPRHIDVLL